MWLEVGQHRGALGRGCCRGHRWRGPRLRGWGTCQDTCVLPGVLQGKARLSPHRGHTLLLGLLLPIRREGRGQHGHWLQEGSRDTARCPQDPLPGHPGPTTAVPQPGGAAHGTLVPSHSCIHAGSEHPLPPRRAASPIAASPAMRPSLGRPKGCGMARMSSLPNLRVPSSRPAQRHSHQPARQAEPWSLARGHRHWVMRKHPGSCSAAPIPMSPSIPPSRRRQEDQESQLRTFGLTASLPNETEEGSIVLLRAIAFLALPQQTRTHPVSGLISSRSAHAGCVGMAASCFPLPQLPQPRGCPPPTFHPTSPKTSRLRSQGAAAVPPHLDPLCRSSSQTFCRSPRG